MSMTTRRIHPSDGFGGIADPRDRAIARAAARKGLVVAFSLDAGERLWTFKDASGEVLGTYKPDAGLASVGGRVFRSRPFEVVAIFGSMTDEVDRAGNGPVD